jgi:hypothetical protein
VWATLFKALAVQWHSSTEEANHSEKVLAIPLLLPCLCKISGNSSIAFPFGGRALLILLREEQQYHILVWEELG